MHRLHFTLLFLLLADGLLNFGGGWSYRGQWFDLLVLAGPLLTALWLLFRSGGRLTRGQKAYFVSVPILYVLASPLMVLSGVWGWHETYAGAEDYEARALRGVFAFEGIEIIRKCYLFEEVISDPIGCEFGGRGAFVFKPDSVGVVVRNGAERDTVFVGR